MTEKRERIIGLDVLRSLAIVGVLFSHTLYFIGPLKALPVLGRLVDFGIRFSAPLGVLGVELFFVLSGFLIGTILIRQYKEAADFGMPEVRIFLLKRWFRTLPLYWLILVTDIILYSGFKLSGIEAYKLLYFPFAQNLWYPHPPYFFGEAWSLAVEEWFYLLLPFGLLASHRLFPPADKRKLLFRVLLAGCLMGIAIRFLHALSGVEDQDSGIRKIVLYRLDALMYGVLCAYYYVFYEQKVRSLAKKLFFSGLLCVAFSYFLISAAGLNISFNTIPWLRFLGDAFLYSVLPLSFTLLLPYAATVKKLPGRLPEKIVSFISRISYSIYLTHYSLLFIPTLSKWTIDRPVPAALIYIVYYIVVFGLSYLLYRFVETPFMHMREQVIGKYRSKNNRMH